jgi:translocation and assembly module TamB
MDPQPGMPPPADAEPATIAAHPAARAAPWATAARLLLPFVLVAALAAAVLGALAYGARWLLLTEDGTRWLLGVVPGVQVDGLRGTLLGDELAAERVSVRWKEGQAGVDVEGLRLAGVVWRWQPEDGLWVALEVARAQARRVTVNTGPADPEVPVTPPESLAVPLLAVRVAEAALDELRIDALDPITALTARELSFDGRAEHRHAVGALAGQGFGLRVQAQASMGNAAPLPLEATLSATPQADPTDAPSWAAVLGARGPLAALDLTSVLRGVARADAPAPQAELEARVQPFDRWPVQRLVARTEGLDLAALAAGAPRTRLAGRIEVQAPARDAPIVARSEIDNQMPGRWDESRLPFTRLEFDASGTLARLDRVEAPRIEIRLANRAGPAGRLSGRATWTGHALDAEIRLAEVTPQRLDARAPEMVLNGPLQLALRGLPSPDPQARGVRPPWDVDARLALEGRFAAAPTPVQVAAELHAAENRLELRTLRARAGGAVADLRALLARNGSRADWQLQTSGRLADFDPLPWWPGEPGSNWRQGRHWVNANWEFDLRLPPARPGVALLEWAQRIAGNGRLQMRDSQLAGVPVAADFALGHAPRSPTPGTLRLDLTLAGNRLLAEAQGNPAGGGAGDRLRAELQAPQLAALAPLARLHPLLAEWLPRGGGAAAIVAVDGRWPAIGTEGQVRVERLRAGELAVERGAMRWSLRIGQGPDNAPLALAASADGVQLGKQRAERLRADLRGTLADHRIDMYAALPVAPPIVAEQLLGLQVRRGTRADLVAQGQWRSEPGGGGRWRARVERVAVGPWDGQPDPGLRPPPIAGTAPASTQAGIARTAPTPPSMSTAPTASSRSDASTAPSAPAAPAARAAAPASPGAPPPSTASTASAASAATAAIAAAGSPAAAAPTAAWAEAQGLQVELGIDREGALRALRADPGKMRVGGAIALHWDAVRVDLRDDRTDFELRADIEDFAAAPLLARALPGMGWAGDLRLAARVAVKAAERFEADMVFERRAGDLHFDDASGVQLFGLTEMRLALAVRDGRWEFSPILQGRSLGELRGTLRARTTPERRWPGADAPLEGEVQARVADLGIWSSWVPPGWRLAGELRTTASVGGRFGAPTYTGELSGSGIAVRHLLHGVNVSDGELRVVLAGETARIERFTLRGGDGRIEVGGSGRLGETPGAQLQLNAERFRVLGRVDRQIVASGQANLVLGADAGRLDGQFRVDEGLFDFTRTDAPSLDGDVHLRRPGEAEPEVDAAAEARTRSDFTLGVDIDLGQQLRLRGRGLETGLTGPVRVSNPGGRLALHGTIRTDGGTYAAYGQRLEIDRGSIEFSGPLENPRLDILAIRPNLDVRVGVQIGGTAQLPRVRLYSFPLMNDNETLSWLLLGRAPEGLGKDDSAMLQRAAFALMAGEGEAPTDTLLRNVGIDELSIRQTDGDTRDTIVTLGKQLSRRWFVGYERGVNATRGNFQIIYRIAQRLTIRAQSGEDNSLDVIWVWRFQEPPLEGGMRKSIPASPP